MIKSNEKTNKINEELLNRSKKSEKNAITFFINY
jgi:hypothetical protein